MTEKNGRFIKKIKDLRQNVLHEGKGQEGEIVFTCLFFPVLQELEEP